MVRRRPHPVKKREVITRELMNRLEGGSYKPGDFLPPERTLAEEFGVSRPTLRKAIVPLVAAGKLLSHPGIGTRVATPGRREQAESATASGWRILALVLPDIANPFFLEVMESIEYVALQRGYQVLLCNTRRQAALEELHIRQLVERKVDGVILAQGRWQGLIGMLADAGIPYVLLFNSPHEPVTDAVVLDEKSGVEQLMLYLCSLGHRAIAYCRPTGAELPHPRELAYRHFMEANGCPVEPHFLIPYRALENSGGQAFLEALFRQKPAPTAFFAGNDQISLGLMKLLAALDIKVPDEVSVIGFDNLRVTEHLPIPLTTVDQPKHEMGRRAAELLLERIEIAPNFKPRVEVFQPHLIIRNSCAMVSSRRLIGTR